MERISKSLSPSFRLNEPIIKVSADEICFLRKEAEALGRSRICFHKSEQSSMHGMLICLKEGCFLGFEKNILETKLYVVLEGVLKIVISNDDGEFEKVLNVRGNEIFCIAENRWHTTISESGDAIYVEMNVRNEALQTKPKSLELIKSVSDLRMWIGES